MTRSTRVSSLALSLAFTFGLLAVGCDGSSKATSKESVPFEPERVKAQEDGMRKAAEDAAKAAK